MILRLLVLSWAYSTVLVVLLLAILAMLGDGTIKLDFNHYGEGWLEVGLSVTAAILMPPISLAAIKRKYNGF